MAEFHVSDATTFNTLVGLSSPAAADGDVVFVESDLTLSAAWMPPDGVSVISNKADGTKAKLTGGSLNNVSLKGSSQPDRVRVKGFDMNESIQLWDATRFIVEDFFLHDIGGDAVFWRGHDRDDISGAMINGRLKNIGQVLEQAGAGFNDSVRVTVLVKDITRFREIHDARLEFFHKDHLPASTMVEISEFVHEDALIEIDAVAVVGA